MYIIVGAIVILILVILVLCLLYYQRELKHLYMQLEHIRQGSHIELTALGRDRAFLRLYRRLNLVITDAYASEADTRKAEKRLKQTITNIAHDIRTPLTGAAGYLLLLEDCTHDDLKLRYEVQIQRRLEELESMLEELFLYTKLSAPDFKLDCQKTAVYPILSECMISMYHVFAEKGTTPECISFTNPLPDEAIKELSAAGPAFLFERFYKSDQSRGKGSSGLGLSIVKELMLQMGGSVQADLENGCLTITLQFASHC